MSMKAWRHRSD